MIRIAIASVVLLFQSCQILYADEIVEEYLSRMTLKEKVGQILLVGLQGQVILPYETDYIRRINPGGVVFYRRNFKDASDITQLISKIKSIPGTNHELPMFFAIDQEGGIVHRIEGDLYKPPSAPAIGAANLEELAWQVGLSVGGALRSLGININLSPVLDIPDSFSSPMLMRGYGSDSRLVSRLGVAYIKGIKHSELLATAKHFPGIGRTREDSHFKVPVITWKTRDDKDNDMSPFTEAIKARVDIIMVGHIIAQPGDSEIPASLSSYWMRDILRKELEFNGLIIVDNIETKAIERIMPISEAVIRSFNAGADIIMISHERKNQETVFYALLNAVKKGEIPLERLDESVGRIILTKRKFLTNHKRNDMEFNSNLRDISRSIAENSTIALRLKDVPPLKLSNNDRVLYAGNNLVLLNIIRGIQPNTEVLSRNDKTRYKSYYKDILKMFDGFILIDGDHPDVTEILSICNELNKEYVLILSFSRKTHKTIERLWPKRIVITFDNSPMYLQAVAEIIFGLRQAKGRLPYNIDFSANYRYES